MSNCVDSAIIGTDDINTSNFVKLSNSSKANTPTNNCSLTKINISAYTTIDSDFDSLYSY